MGHTLRSIALRAPKGISYNLEGCWEVLLRRWGLGWGPVDTNVREGLAVWTKGTEWARALGRNSRSPFLSFGEVKGTVKAGATADWDGNRYSGPCLHKQSWSFVLWVIESSWKFPSPEATWLELSVSSSNNMVNGFGRFTLERGSSIKNLCLSR